MARDEYLWLSDLSDIGYDRDDIAELLVDVESGNPWIYIEPATVESFMLRSGIHREACVHHAASISQSSGSAPDALTPLLGRSFLDPERQSQIRRRLGEYCGLAGAVPLSRRERDWDAHVEFQRGAHITTALISYSPAAFAVSLSKSQDERMIRIGARLRSAFGLSQTHGICCDSFTILHWVGSDHTDHVVHLRRIEAQSVLGLVGAIDGMRKYGRHQMEGLSRLAEDIIACVIHPVDTRRLANYAGSPGRLNQILHRTSLALQILSLGLLSYGRAHFGRLDPAFLIHPVHRVVLQGSEHSTTHIVVEPMELTCMGGMTKGSVLVFRPSGPSFVQPEGLRYDLLATPEDLIDAWGPALIVTDPSLLQESKVLSVEIGGGLLRSTAAPGTLHWQHSQLDHGVDQTPWLADPFSLKTCIYMGMLQVNPKCPLQAQDKEDDLRRSCGALLPVLGTSRSTWYHKTKTLGIRGGQYGVLTFGVEFEKREGVKAKDKIFQTLDSICPSISLQDLEAFYGLQISLCTGVARRVPLRLLLADVLATYVESNAPTPPDWPQLRNPLLAALAGPGFRAWFSTLPSADIQGTIVTLLGKLLRHLRHTGLDSSGYLRVAWIRFQEDQLCFRLRCDDRNLWARILEDTEYCATFACITTTCLEENNLHCRGAQVSSWQNVSELMATEVCQHDTGRTISPTFTLQDRVRYWIGPPASGLLAFSRLAGSPPQPVLEISRNWRGRIPERFHGRIIKTAQEHIRERGAIGGQTILVAVRAQNPA